MALTMLSLVINKVVHAHLSRCCVLCSSWMLESTHTHTHH